MRVNRSGALAAGLLAAPYTNGCGCPPEQMKTAQVDTVHTRAITLPSWAPDDPSPEFLRAWAVLKPTPEDEFARFAEGDPARLALARRASRTWAAAYQFFGTLTDEQIERFLSTKQIAIPAKSLTPKQRRALDNWFEVWREVMKGLDGEDYLLLLYKMGAEEDLSNVRVRFIAHGSHAVHIAFWVTPPGGEEGHIGTWFANT